MIARRSSNPAAYFKKFWALALLVMACLILKADAQEVLIPDPGLNAAVREALQKPVGPLTEQDMLGMTLLSACCRGISSLEGLDAARNLTILDLHANSLTNCVIPSSLTRLRIVDLFQNQLASFTLTNAFSEIEILNLSFNALNQCVLPAGLTNLDTLFLENNRLTNFSLPPGLSRLNQLDLSGNALNQFVFPADATNLATALIFANRLTNVVFAPGQSLLISLALDFNRLRSLSIPATLTNLSSLTLLGNQLTNLAFPTAMPKLGFLDAGDNQLGSIALPERLDGLSFLRLSGNRLTNFALPSGMTNLGSMFLRSNQLAALTLPPGLTSLVQIDVTGNQLASLFLPADMTQLLTLGLEGNPLDVLVLTEPLAATNLAATVTSLRNQGVEVFAYSLFPRLFQARQSHDAFQFSLTGPPGDYTILATEDLQTWSPVRTIKNRFGVIGFTDVPTPFPSRKFYRAQRQISPTNMVFIPPNTFTMGSPTNELHRQPNEGPQTVVTLTRGFWIGKYEVIQGEYLSVTGTNPSQFPGDLSRPVSSVSWPDATNYCAMLTQRELLAGRIPANSRYRLPTEAEWECAARAGTTTRFSYGDDPDYSNLPNYAWQSVDDGLTVHPIGQKLPNPWGLHDMMGNVFEWCQDWLGPLPGGSVSDPQGPPSNQIGWKVMRGGAFDTGETACRSASRMFFGNHPALTDWNLGFRVVLVTEP